MTLKENTKCQCIGNNCVDCKCGCSGDCCNVKSTSIVECPFLKSHPNWQSCPFMSKLFSTPTLINTDSDIAIIDHSKCDESKCSNVPMTQCTSCHKTPGFTHTVTLNTDTEVAADQGEDLTL